jgi:hypothetical protein
MFFIFSSYCDPDKGSNYNCKLMDYRRYSKKWNNLTLKMTHWSSNWSIVNEILSGEEVDIFNPSLISELHKLRSSKKYLNTKGKEMIGKLDGLLKFLRVREPDKSGLSWLLSLSIMFWVLLAKVRITQG